MPAVPLRLQYARPRDAVLLPWMWLLLCFLLLLVVLLVVTVLCIPAAPLRLRYASPLDTSWCPFSPGTPPVVYLALDCTCYCALHSTFRGVPGTALVLSIVL